MRPDSIASSDDVAMIPFGLRLFRIREVAEATGYSPAFIWRLIAERKLKVVRVARTTRVPGSELIRLQETNQPAA